MQRLKMRISQHMQTSWWIYLLVGLCFMGGLVFGALAINTLDDQQFSDMQQNLDSGFTQISENIDFAQTTKQAALKNMAALGKISILGLTVIGFPLILAIIFTRGFVISFTVAFLLQEKSLKGGLMALLTVIPPNLLSLPAYLAAAVLAINFSLYLVRGRENLRSMPITQYFLGYSVIMLALAVLMLCASFIEGYFSPIFIRLLM